LGLSLYGLALRPAEHIHQLRDLPALIGLVAARNRVFDAVTDMVAQDFLLDALERRSAMKPWHVFACALYTP
jgi:hypothetical protein